MTRLGMNLLEQLWAQFSEHYVREKGLEDLLPALRCCYYAGMLAVFIMWTDTPHLKEQIDRELDAFIRQTRDFTNPS